MGGTRSGNGGFVEVSGKQTLNFAGTVTTKAPHGKAGTLLLDPAHIEIVETAGTDPAVTYIQVSALVQALNSNNVTIDAISATANGIGVGNWNGSDGVITVASAIDSRGNSNSHSLTLLGSVIKFDANINLKGDLTLRQSGNTSDYGLSFENCQVAVDGNLVIEQTGSSTLFGIHLEGSTLTVGGDLSLIQTNTGRSGNSGIYLAASSLSATGNLSLIQNGTVGGANPGLSFFAQGNSADKGVILSAGSDKWVTIRSNSRNLRLGNQDQFVVKSGRVRLDLGTAAVESRIGPVPSGGYSLFVEGLDVYFTGDSSGGYFNLEIGSGSFTAVTTNTGQKSLSAKVDLNPTNYGWVLSNGAAISAVGVGFATTGSLDIDATSSLGYDYLEGQTINGTPAPSLSAKAVTPFGNDYYLKSNPNPPAAPAVPVVPVAPPNSPAPAKPAGPVATPPATPPTGGRSDSTATPRPVTADPGTAEVPEGVKPNDLILAGIAQSIVNENSIAMNLGIDEFSDPESSRLFVVENQGDGGASGGTRTKNLMTVKLKAILTPIPSNDANDDLSDYYKAPTTNRLLWN